MNAILLIYAFSKRPQTAKEYKARDLATNEDIDLETVIKTVCGREAAVELIGIILTACLDNSFRSYTAGQKQSSLELMAPISTSLEYTYSAFPNAVNPRRKQCLSAFLKKSKPKNIGLA